MDFLKPKLLRFIDLTDTDLIIFCKNKRCKTLHENDFGLLDPEGGKDDATMHCGYFARFGEPAPQVLGARKFLGYNGKGDWVGNTAARWIQFDQFDHHPIPHRRCRQDVVVESGADGCL